MKSKFAEKKSMLRTHTCGEIRKEDIGKEVKLCGWVQKVRNKGTLIWVDLRDRYGITQLIIDQTKDDVAIYNTAESLGREFVITVTGQVIERESKNPKLLTGDIEIRCSVIEILNKSEVPPFTIEDETDGGDELRMKYRYLDLRREPLKKNLFLRHRLMQITRKYLDGNSFLEIETPILIKSTPEGARDFVVPSRVNKGEFYALPQSPQTFKQLLMVAGYDRYFQIVRCFRDEDLRADRQPEFTQIDCEMSFIEREDILQMFEGLTKEVFKEIKGIDFADFERMEYADAMRLYGNDKPDLRFGMQIQYLNHLTQNLGFKVFDDAETIAGIVVPNAAEYTRKQLDELTEWVKRPQIGAKGLVYMQCKADGTFKSSVDKFYTTEQLQAIANFSSANAGDLMLIISGKEKEVRKQLSELRLEMGRRLNLMAENDFKPLWVVNFPLFDYDEETDRYHAMHHPFTSPLPNQLTELKSNPANVMANAYDLVINGVEIGGGSIRIHNQKLQSDMFDVLGFTKEDALAQFGFLMGAFKYGAPPHGGIAFGFDRLCAVLSGVDSIRDFIAFPKNNSGKDTMIDAPSPLDSTQLKELGIKTDL